VIVVLKRISRRGQGPALPHSITADQIDFGWSDAIKFYPAD